MNYLLNNNKIYNKYNNYLIKTFNQYKIIKIQYFKDKKLIHKFK